MILFHSRPMRALLTALLFLCSVMAGFLIIEFGLRLALYGSLEWRQTDRLPLMRVPHPTLGWLLAPNQHALEQELEYKNEVTTNSKGLRDREYPYQKDGAFRILLFGDSYMEAVHVAEGDGFPDVMERLLTDRRVEVINMGVGGYATVAQWRYLLEEGIKYAPDLVLVAFYAENDVYGNSPELSRQFWREDNVRYYGQPYVQWNETEAVLDLIPPDYDRSKAGYEERLAAYSPRLYQLQAFQKSLTSHLYQQMRLKYITRVRTPGKDVVIHFGCYMEDFLGLPKDNVDLAPELYDASWQEAWFLTEQVLIAMAAAAEANGARFAFFNAPARVQFEQGYENAVRKEFPWITLNTGLPEEKLMAFAEEHHISFYNLLPAFRKADSEGQVLSYNHDSHWNADGHRLAAETVVQWLEAQEFIPSREDSPNTL